MAVLQKAYDDIILCLKSGLLDGSIGDYVFVGMTVDPYSEEDEDYIEFNFLNKVNEHLPTFYVSCTKGCAARINHLSNSPCKESTWESFGICDDGYSKVNFDYWLQIGALEGYSEGE